MSDRPLHVRLREDAGTYVPPQIERPVDLRLGGIPPEVATGAPLPGPLTADELRAIDLAAELYNLLARIVGRSPSRAGDIGEFTIHIHGIQQAVMSQAAARAYPERFRLLGETLKATDE